LLRWLARSHDVVSKVKAMDRSKSGIQRFRRACFAGLHRWVTIALNVLYTKEQLVKLVIAGIMLTKP
jgi:hypothetical protein